MKAGACTAPTTGTSTNHPPPGQARHRPSSHLRSFSSIASSPGTNGFVALFPYYFFATSPPKLSLHPRFRGPRPQARRDGPLPPPLLYRRLNRGALAPPPPE